VAARRRNFEYYHARLGSLPGLEFMPEAKWGVHSRWLTTLTVAPEVCGVSRDELRCALEAANIEARAEAASHLFVSPRSTGNFYARSCQPSGDRKLPRQLLAAGNSSASER
jgi:dTDP-4-amino-4,6-dideoxygalactose transaminase